MASQEINSTSLKSDPNIQAYYRFESNVNDTSANGYTLTATGSPTYGAGEFGNAIIFITASSQYASITNASGANLNITGSRTIHCWFNPTNHTQLNFIAGKFNNANQGYIIYQDTNGKINFTCSGLTTNTTVIGGTVLSNGTWYQIDGVYNGSNLTIYINGVSDGSSAATGSSDSVTTSFATGCSFQGGGNTAANFASASIDDLAVFNRALSPNDIQALYNGTYGQGGGAFLLNLL